MSSRSSSSKAGKRQPTHGKPGKEGRRGNPMRPALEASLLYAFFAALWIGLSGFVLTNLIRDPHTVIILVFIDGSVSVAATAFALYGVLSRQACRLKTEVVAREQAEQRTGESEERFSTIFRSSPVAIILSRLEDGRLVDINPASLKLLGYAREELMDRTSLEVGIWSFPEYRNRLVEIMRARGRVEDVEIEFRKKSGETGTILGSAELISLAGVDHLLNMGIDITDRKRAEEAIHSSRLKLTEAMDLARVVQWEVDLTTKELVLNDAYYTLYGTTAEQEGGYRIPGEDYVKRFVHPDDRWSFRQAAERRLINGESEFIEDSKHRIVRRDGEVRHILVRVHVSKDRAGYLIRYYGANQDITERKRAEEKLESALRNLRKAIGGTIEAIIQVVEMRDPYTAGHQRRVAHLARAMATEMGLPFDMIEGIRMAAVIHDIGKVSVPAEILSKPGKLTEKEFELVKDHTVTGYDILKDLEFPWPIAEIIYQHHEKLDGSGYPRGLKGDEVLMEARIIAVADVVEAMASHRPFRPALGMDAALDEIKAHRGSLYDPDAVDTCVKLFTEKGYTLTDRKLLAPPSSLASEPRTFNRGSDIVRSC